jgi:peptidoglycan/LPS O-acetylase OafA/YrhL
LLICVISTLSLSCLVAHFSEKYIEKPGIKLGRSIIDKFKTRLEVV